MLELPPCAICHDRRHIQTGKGWRRCRCMAPALVLPELRHNDLQYPGRFNAMAALPLQDATVIGDYDEFRYRAWRSVLDYPHVVYDVVTMFQLVELHFSRDETSKYGNIRELVPLGLLILLLGVAEMPHSFLGPAALMILTLRQQQGRPTWVYSARPLSGVRTAYTPELADRLALSQVFTTGTATVGKSSAPAGKSTTLVNPTTV